MKSSGENATPRIIAASFGDIVARFPADISEVEVPVCVVSLESPPTNPAELRECLIPQEQERADRYKVHKARHEFIVARGLLRQLLGACLGLSPRDVPITYAENGKPLLVGGAMHFNVTHTESVALIAIARRPVGIDVERLRIIPNESGLVDRFFSPAEREMYHALPSELQHDAFYRGWTSKEAVIKAAGLSVMCLAGFDVELHPARPAAVLATRHPVLDQSGWQLSAWEVAPGFAAAVALGWE